MNLSIFMNGQWAGFFVYGSEYGDILDGEVVQFRLFLEDIDNGQFAGMSIDLDGKGSLFERATINGFTDNLFISFTKQYALTHYIDAQGNIDGEAVEKPQVIYYSGLFEPGEQVFRGNWELWTTYHPVEGRLVAEAEEFVMYKGTWEMKKDD